jgi:hypothetical protein
MKKFSNLFVLAITVFTFASCANETNNSANVTIDDVTSTRGVETVNFMGMQKTVAKEDIITVSKDANAKQDDDAVTSIMGRFMAAKNEAMLLDVNFTMSDEPVSDMFVFGIETEDEKELTFEMYDEEGFEMAANNTISVTQGNNYKALNVKSLDEGNYFFKLKDESGKELTREVKIER